MKQVCVVQNNTCINTFTVDDAMTLTGNNLQLSGPATVTTYPMNGDGEPVIEHYTATMDAPEGCTFLLSEAVHVGYLKQGPNWVPPTPTPPDTNVVSLEEFIDSLTDTQSTNLLASTDKRCRRFLFRGAAHRVYLDDPRTIEVLALIA